MKLKQLRDDTHMTSMKVVQFSKPPTHCPSKFFHPLDLGRSISNKALSSPNNTVHVNERNRKKDQTKSRHLQIDHVFHCSIYPRNNAMVSLKDGFTV